MQKHKIGDKIWFLKDNKVVSEKVTGFLSIGGKYFYTIENFKFGEYLWNSDVVSENGAFPSKESLIESLK